MNKTIRAGLIAVFAIATALAGAGGVSATKPDENGDHKVQLCHRTASDTNPYVLIEVDVASLDAHLNNLPGHPAKTNADGSPRNDYLYSEETPCSPEPTPTSTPTVTSEPTPTPTSTVTPSSSPDATPSVAPSPVPTPSEPTSTPTPTFIQPVAVLTLPPTDTAEYDGAPASADASMAAIGRTLLLIGAFWFIINVIEGRDIERRRRNGR